MAEYFEIVFRSQVEYAPVGGRSVFCDDDDGVPVGPAPKKPVRMITNSTALEELAEDMLGQDAVGLDVETTLSCEPDLCLAQFALPEYDAVIDPFELDTLEPLREILERVRPVKIIHNAPFERSVLGRLGFRIDGVYDTLSVSRSLRGRRVEGGNSLGAVCRRELGIGLNKILQRSDWARRPLSREQLKYAAMDAEVLLELYSRFRVEAGERGSRVGRADRTDRSD